MQQLMIPFEEFGWNSQPVNASTAKQCKEDSVSNVESQVLTWISSKADHIKNLAAATVMVAFGFSLMFFAALIGG